MNTLVKNEVTNKAKKNLNNIVTNKAKKNLNDIIKNNNIQDKKDDDDVSNKSRLSTNSYLYLKVKLPENISKYVDDLINADDKQQFIVDSNEYI